MARPTHTIPGKVVAITGAGRGIGRATAKALIARGAVVAIGDIDLDVAQRRATELGPIDVLVGRLSPLSSRAACLTGWAASAMATIEPMSRVLPAVEAFDELAGGGVRRR
ncbi:MAG: SDR family NAD(P)-dependent oxidoreductase [Solirubrobacterales bacterium]|nr:SDR family NAD(P)-dependent oxidoreductase [Solirubrobacterales bacterium]